MLAASPGHSGLRIHRFFTKQDIKSSRPLWNQEFLDKHIFYHAPIEIDGVEHNKGESSITQVVRRMANTWRWWGDTYGYFERKSDAQAFADEIEYCLLQQIFSPGLPHWRSLGLRTAYNQRNAKTSGNYFVDPETQQPLICEEEFAHPVLFDSEENQHPVFQCFTRCEAAQLPNIAGDDALEFITSICLVALDISFLISAYTSEQVARNSVSHRKVNIQKVSFGNNESDEQMLSKQNQAVQATTSLLKNTFSRKFEQQVSLNNFSVTNSNVNTDFICQLWEITPTMSNKQDARQAEVAETSSTKQTTTSSKATLPAHTLSSLSHKLDDSSLLTIIVDENHRPVEIFIPAACSASTKLVVDLLWELWLQNNKSRTDVTSRLLQHAAEIELDVDRKCLTKLIPWLQELEDYFFAN